MFPTIIINTTFHHNLKLNIKTKTAVWRNFIILFIICKKYGVYLKENDRKMNYKIFSHKNYFCPMDLEY